MASVLRVHFGQVVDRCGNRHTPHNTIERPHATILVSTLEHQASKNNTYHKIVNLQCKLAYAPKYGSDTITHVIVNNINCIEL